MRFNLGIAASVLLSCPAFGFVHISQLKPRLPVSPDSPSLTFYWNGDAPELLEKEDFDDGAYADASDQQLMQTLLERSMDAWNEVPTAYVELNLAVNSSAHIDDQDETYSIVVEPQDSAAVAAAALPSFVTNDPDASDRERDPHIIHDCDITVSTDSVTAKSLLQTLTHEMGHCLGLGHPHSSYKSIMSYSPFGRSSGLALDDKAGVSFLYPEPTESEQVRYLTQCGVVGGGTNERAGLWFGLPLMLVAMRRAYKRKM